MGHMLGQLGIQGGQLGLQGAQQRAQLGETLGRFGLQRGQFGLQGAQQMSQLGDQLGTLGLRQSALGELGQTLGQREAGFLFDMGARGQAQQQAEIEALRQSQLAQMYEPYQRVAYLSDIYKGAPSSQIAITGSTAPQASTAQQMLGLGISALGAYRGAKGAMGGF